MAPSISSPFFSTAAAAAHRTLAFSTKATPPPPQEKKSFAVATGELFLGIASRVLKKGGKMMSESQMASVVEMFAEEDEAEWWWRRRRKERIAAVVQDPVQPEVVWEQTERDVEAERRRKAVTSPGFSFSAAGLLFPYHLGVAQLLIERGYIKDDMCVIRELDSRTIFIPYHI